MNKWNISFEAFLRTGRLGTIGCGLKKSDVERAIGKPERPEDVEDYPNGNALWCYTPVEVRFFGEQVEDIGIGFRWWDGRFDPRMVVEAFFPEQFTSMSSIHSFLKEKNISFEFGKDGKKLRTAAGVWILPTLDDTLMTVAKQCGGPNCVFDERYRAKG